MNDFTYAEFSTKYFDVGFLTKNARSQTQVPIFSPGWTNQNCRKLISRHIYCFCLFIKDDLSFNPIIANYFIDSSFLKYFNIFNILLKFLSSRKSHIRYLIGLANSFSVQIVKIVSNLYYGSGRRTQLCWIVPSTVFKRNLYRCEDYLLLISISASNEEILFSWNESHDVNVSLQLSEFYKTELPIWGFHPKKRLEFGDFQLVGDLGISPKSIGDLRNSWDSWVSLYWFD